MNHTDKRVEAILKRCWQEMSLTRLAHLIPDFQQAVATRFDFYTHGFLTKWLDAIDALPQYARDTLDLTDGVSASQNEALTQAQKRSLVQQLMTFQPWRKGPYHIHGLHLDTEWRSDWKWQRIKSHISPLKNRIVLDVGCGNAYHGWRMCGEKAKLVIGVDPSQLFWMQFLVIKHFIGNQALHLLPIGVELLPEDCQAFDTVFSMGVFYHRQSPFEHLQQLKSLLRPGGELVLETLVIDGGENQVLLPKDRYASMRNVWFLPSALALESWLARAGFHDIKLVDVNQTSCEEQRQTDWINTHSLAQFLNPQDPNLTIEGYPAPKRATFIVTK